MTAYDDISEQDGFYGQRTAGYLVLYPVLREVARGHGYALAVHGSLQKDLDVLAVPWVEECSDPDVLAEALRDKSGGQFVGGVGLKPHGRKAYTIHLGLAGYIDLSVAFPQKTCVRVD